MTKKTTPTVVAANGKTSDLDFLPRIYHQNIFMITARQLPQPRSMQATIYLLINNLSRDNETSSLFDCTTTELTISDPNSSWCSPFPSGSASHLCGSTTRRSIHAGARQGTLPWCGRCCSCRSLATPRPLSHCCHGLAIRHVSTLGIPRRWLLTAGKNLKKKYAVPIY